MAKLELSELASVSIEYGPRADRYVRALERHASPFADPLVDLDRANLGVESTDMWPTRSAARSDAITNVDVSLSPKHTFGFDTHVSQILSMIKVWRSVVAELLGV